MADPKPCKTCEGSGRVVTFFDGSVRSWPEQVRIAASFLTTGVPWDGSATASGLIKPSRCPDCDGVERVPAAVLIPNFVRSGVLHHG